MDDESLIVCIQDYPNLYDQSHAKYHDTNMKMNSWLDIGLRLNQPADQCRLKWKSLRECYRKALKKRETKSGQASKKIKPWRLEQQMEFLKRFVYVQRDQESNVSDDESDLLHESNPELDSLEAVESAESSVEVTTAVEVTADVSAAAAASPATTTSTGDTENVTSKPSRKRPVNEGSTLKKPKSFMTPTAAVFQEYINFRKQQGSNKLLETRHVDHLTKYFQGVEGTVRTLPKEIQIKVKSKISQIVHDAELEAMYSTATSSDLQKKVYIPQQQSALYHALGDFQKPQEGLLDFNHVSPTTSYESSNYSCRSSPAETSFSVPIDPNVPNVPPYVTCHKDGTHITNL